MLYEKSSVSPWIVPRLHVLDLYGVKPGAVAAAETATDKDVRTLYKGDGPTNEGRPVQGILA